MLHPSMGLHLIHQKSKQSRVALDQGDFANIVHNPGQKRVLPIRQFQPRMQRPLGQQLHFGRVQRQRFEFLPFLRRPLRLVHRKAKQMRRYGHLFNNAISDISIYSY